MTQKPNPQFKQQTKQLHELTLAEARAGLRSGQFSSVELTQALLDRIAAVDPSVKAYLTVTPERALAQAKLADDRRRRGEDGPLLGLPLAIKDVLSTAGVRTTAGSRILENYAPPFTATAVERLEAAGMVMLGKTNTDEFAMGSSTENSGYFTTHNPWDLDRVPGGSSGGSGAAVSAQLALAALGTDTGGSVRLPASYCGVVGLKPSYGRVSRYGLIAYGSSLDQIGVLAKDVADAALVLAGDRRARSLRQHQPRCAGARLLGGADGRDTRPARWAAQGIFYRGTAARGQDCGRSGGGAA